MQTACIDAMCMNNKCSPAPKAEYSMCNSPASGFCVANACTVPQRSSIQDTTTGTDVGQVNYAVGAWSVAGDVHYTEGTGGTEYYTAKFVGFQVAVHGGKNNDRGIAAYSICDENGLSCGSETEVDAYFPTLLTDQVLWTSPRLSFGKHMVKVRATHKHNNSSMGFIVDLDYFQVN
jgi:hypothetical protein